MRRDELLEAKGERREVGRHPKSNGAPGAPLLTIARAREDATLKRRCNVEEIITIDSGSRVKVWKTGAGLHILGEAGDGKGGWTTTSILTLPLGEVVAEVVQAVLRTIK